MRINAFRLAGLLALCLAFPRPALALGGNDAGNGGHSVVCRDQAGTIKSVEMFDLWYAVREGRLPLLSSPASAEDLGKEIAVKLYEADQNEFGDILASYANVLRAQVQVGKDLQLIPPVTFLGNLVPSVDSGCDIEPLAVYTDTGVLLTNDELWRFLQSPANPGPRSLYQAAFYVHEALGDLYRGQIEKKGLKLDDETRKAIARKTVNLTALAFSDLSTAQLGKRIALFLTTGQLSAVVKVNKIEFTRRLGSSGFSDKTQAAAAAAQATAQYKQQIQAALDPKSEFVLVNCEPPYVSLESYFRWDAQCHVVAVPKSPVVKITEMVRSVFTMSDDRSLGWPSNAPALYQSYLVNYAQWSRDVAAKQGAALYYVDQGPLHTNEPDFYIKRYYRNWAWHRPYGPLQIGNAEQAEVGAFLEAHWLGDLAEQEAEVYLYANPADLRVKAFRIQGQPYSFGQPDNEPGERAAAYWSFQDWTQKCAVFKQAHKQDPGAVYVSCGDKSLEYSAQSDTVTAFSSTGYVYSVEP